MAKCECAGRSICDYCDDTWATYGNLQVVGHAGKKKPTCGQYIHTKGCLGGDGSELHKGVVIDGKDMTGKMFGYLVHASCHRWDCSVCYKSAAAREAHKIEVRIQEMEHRVGFKAEHFICSVNPSDYHLSYDQSKEKALKVLYARGFEGGVLIYHHARYANREEAERKSVPFGWRFSPHYHVIGFVKSGYRCRECHRNTCVGCEGFENVTWREHERDGWVVKVAQDKHGRALPRVSIRLTAYYQLEHSSIRTDVVRPHPATWFGTCSYRRLKVKIPKRVILCPICEAGGVESECEVLIHVGSGRIVKDKDSPDYVAEFVEDILDASGELNWVIADSDSSERDWYDVGRRSWSGRLLF